VVADFAATMAGAAYDTVIADQDPLALADAAIPVMKKAARADNLVLAEKLLDRTGDVTRLLAKLDRLEAKLAEQGTTLDAFADRAVDLTAQAAKLLAADEITALVQVEPATVGLLDHATKALAETRGEPVKAAGIFELLAAPFDKDIGRFLGFGLAFARRVGRRL
jgi:uncharacterized protein YjgD (DUF1641 family)